MITSFYPISPQLPCVFSQHHRCRFLAETVAYSNFSISNKKPNKNTQFNGNPFSTTNPSEVAMVGRVHFRRLKKPALKATIFVLALLHLAISSFTFVGASWKVQDRRLFIHVRAEPDTTTEAWKEPKSIVKLTFFFGG